MNDDFLSDFRNHVLYHGTSLGRAESIARKGFRVQFNEQDGEQCCSGGNLGAGIYITCNWRIALWFGPTLLRVGLRPGTRLLFSAVAPDSKTIAYLQREFGREILNSPPWKVIPKNKRLTSHELVALFRYHYCQTWEKSYGTDGEWGSRWPAERERHSRLLDNFRSLLIRYGFHGYGNPADDNGIVVIAGDRLVLQEVVGEIPSSDYPALWKSDFRSLGDVDAVRKLFQTRGSEQARQLAQHVAAPDS